MKILHLTITLFIINIAIYTSNAQWQPTNGPYGGRILCAAVNDSTVYAGTPNGVFVSSVNEPTWAHIGPVAPDFVYNIYCTNLGIYTYASGVMKYCPYTSASFTVVNTGLSDTLTINGLYVSGSLAFVYTQYAGIYIYNITGANWSLYRSSLSGAVYSVNSFGNYFVANTDGYSAFTTDTGTTWNTLMLNSQPLTGHSFASIGNTIFTSADTGIIATNDYGNTWYFPQPGWGANQPSSLLAFDSTLYWSNGSIYMSTDLGANWTDIYHVPGQQMALLTMAGNKLYSISGNEQVYVSTLNDSTWINDNDGLQGSYVQHLAINSTKLFADGNPDGLFYMATGDTWDTINLPNLYGNDVIALAARNNVIVAVFASGGLYVSTDNGATWNSHPLSEPPFAYGIAINDSFIYIPTFSALYVDNIYSPVTTPVSNTDFFNTVSTVAANANDIMAGVSDGLYYSNNKGSSFNMVQNGLYKDFASLLIKDSMFFAVCDSGVFYSFNHGASWNLSSSGLPVNDAPIMIRANDNMLFVMTYSGGLYMSYNNGLDWLPVNTSDLNGNNILDLAAANDRLYAATNAGVWQLWLSALQSCSARFTLYPDTNAANSYYALNQTTGTGTLSYVWNWGDDSTSSGSTPSHTYADSGYYTICLTITDSIGCTSSYCDSNAYLRSTQNLMIQVNVVTSLPTAIANLTNKENISIYPNPSTGSWQLSVGNELLGSALNVYDDEGRLVFHSEISNQNSKLELEVPSGVYYLRISNDNTSVVRKLVKL